MIRSSFSSSPCMSLYPHPITPEQGWHTSLHSLFAVSTFLLSHVFFCHHHLSWGRLSNMLLLHTVAFLIDCQQANEWRSKNGGCFLLGEIYYSKPRQHVGQHVSPNVGQHDRTVCWRLKWLWVRVPLQSLRLLILKSGLNLKLEIYLYKLKLHLLYYAFIIRQFI